MLAAHGRGDPDALNQVFERVYRNLRAMARGRLRGGGGTLGTTGLVHEAYVKLVDGERASWNDRGHFFAVASKAMRQILVDRARARASLKRGGDAPKVTLDEGRAGEEARVVDLVAVDEALGRLEQLAPRLAKVVELRYFGGLTVDETAAVLEIDPRTVKRDWRKARALLHRDLSGSG